MKMKIVQMKTFAFAVIAMLAVSSVNAQSKPIKVIKNADTLITKNTTWDADTIYFLGGKVYVTNNAELTIQPGTVITGDTTTKGALLITKGSKIHAVGTPTCPIVFTSSKAPNKRNRGDWGGVILLGKASINQPGGVANIEGLAPSSLTEYGGGLTPDDNDNSGELEYVRIEFAGVAFAPNNEINGLTFGGVGRGTTIDFVQVSYANDDSYEWFGGTVNCKHLIAFRGIDDDFDTDNGFSGKVQFCWGLRDPLVADVSGSNGFESDNDAAGSTNLPQTRGIFCNMTVCAGADSATNALFRNGAQIRRNSHLYIYNSIIMGYPTGILADGTLSNSNFQTDTLVQNNIIAATQSSKWVVSNTSNTTVTDLLLNHAANRFYTGNAGVGLTNPYNLNKPNPRPAAGSPALSGASFKHVGLNDPFFTQTKYVGAFSKSAAQNWAQIWVNFTPTKTDYSQVNSNCATPSAIAAATSDAVVIAKGDAVIYPNPSKGSFKIDLSGFAGQVSIKVTNTNGAVVYHANNAAGKSIVNVNLTNASAGVYFVTITDGSNTITKKLNIIQ